MKKLNKVAMLFASAALVTAAGAQTIDNWKNGNNELVWKNGTNELCWRDNFWTPATAAPDCDGAIVPVAAPAPAPVAAPAPPPVVAAPAPAPTPPAATKVTYAADAFFDFNKSVIKPAGKAKLTTWLAKSRTSTWKSSLPWVTPTPSVAMRTTRSCRFAARKLSRPTWCPKALRKIAFTPKAKARNSQLLTTRPPKAVRKIVAWKSK